MWRALFNRAIGSEIGAINKAFYSKMQLHSTESGKTWYNDSLPFFPQQNAY